MATSQTTYSARPGEAYAGMPADGEYEAPQAYFADEDDGIGFGVVAKRSGTTAAAFRNCKLGGTSSSGILGITMLDRTQPPGSADKYAKSSLVSVMIAGRIWVKVAGAVTVDNDVTFSSTTGAISSAAASATQPRIAGARFLSSASSGGLAVVWLSGDLRLETS